MIGQSTTFTLGTAKHSCLFFNFFFPFGGRFPYLSVKLSLQMRQNLAIPHVLLSILSQTLILMHPTVVLLIAC